MVVAFDMECTCSYQIHMQIISTHTYESPPPPLSIYMSLFIYSAIYCNSTSKRQTSIIFGLASKGPCGQSELLKLVTGGLEPKTSGSKGRGANP